MLRSGTRRSIKPDQGDSGAAIFDGIAFALDLLKKEPVRNRRAILLISQERDDGSKTSMKEIVRDLGETNTAIYSVTFSAEKTEAKQAFKDPACESADLGSSFRWFDQGLQRSGEAYPGIFQA